MVVRDSSLPVRVTPLQFVMPLIGATVITLAAQVRIDLPFTPVPITGQTFAVVVWGLLFGSRQGALASAAYLMAGALGAPVFAGFTSLTALWGPTAGFLLGFVPAAWVAGGLRERGWTHHPIATFGAAMIASLPIFLLGVPVLASFVGWDNIMVMGVYPFVAGDVIKSGLAALTVYLFNKREG